MNIRISLVGHKVRADLLKEALDRLTVDQTCCPGVLNDCPVGTVLLLGAAVGRHHCSGGRNRRVTN